MNAVTIIFIALALLILAVVILLCYGLKAGRELDENIDRWINERYIMPKKDER